MVRHVGRLLDGGHCSHPSELVTDGRMLDLRGRDTVRIAKVKGHADEGMVLDGRVRELDRLMGMKVVLLILWFGLLVLLPKRRRLVHAVP